ncbi:MAG: hypothetical protein M1826_006796 [Phylliscum demangeonii]|nr:MAG: hypothetical protein M1826_006796 [Phylliscum demangeonii]
MSRPGQADDDAQSLPGVFAGEGHDINHHLILEAYGAKFPELHQHVTQHEVHISTHVAESLATQIRQSSLRFNSARRRYIVMIRQWIDLYESQGNPGPVHRPDPDEHDEIPALAPVRMYGNVLRWLAEAPGRRDRNESVGPPSLVPW